MFSPSPDIEMRSSMPVVVSRALMGKIDFTSNIVDVAVCPYVSLFVSTTATGEAASLH
ncbi:hypothetical protein MNBD_GAMMA01-1639 [hydrothermal vent metagenome]|uniref:Uncharacterized protein n=1 Tax=hydrothermal vent metagenome TaxID=652676 RepID=A0A3B0WA53_9ZZZZ